MKNVLVKINVAVGLAMLPLLSRAAATTGNTTLGTWSDNFIKGTVQPLLQFGVYIFYAVGVIITGIGVHKFIKVSKGDPQSGPGEAAAYCLGGGALMTLGAISNYAANSMNLGTGAQGSFTPANAPTAFLDSVEPVARMLASFVA